MIEESVERWLGEISHLSENTQKKPLPMRQMSFRFNSNPRSSILNESIQDETLSSQEFYLKQTKIIDLDALLIVFCTQVIIHQPREISINFSSNEVHFGFQTQTPQNFEPVQTIDDFGKWDILSSEDFLKTQLPKNQMFFQIFYLQLFYSLNFCPTIFKNVIMQMSDNFEKGLNDPTPLKKSKKG